MTYFSCQRSSSKLVVMLLLVINIISLYPRASSSVILFPPVPDIVFHRGSTPAPSSMRPTLIVSSTVSTSTPMTSTNRKPSTTLEPHMATTEFAVKPMILYPPIPDVFIKNESHAPSLMPNSTVPAFAPTSPSTLVEAPPAALVKPMKLTLAPTVTSSPTKNRPLLQKPEDTALFTTNAPTIPPPPAVPYPTPTPSLPSPGTESTSLTPQPVSNNYARKVAVGVTAGLIAVSLSIFVLMCYCD